MQSVGGAPVTSTTITNNVVSGNALGGINVRSELAAGPGDLRDRGQPDRDQRRRDGGAGERCGLGSFSDSVENATVLNNVISANTVGLWLNESGTEVET